MAIASARPYKAPVAVRGACTKPSTQDRRTPRAEQDEVAKKENLSQPPHRLNVMERCEHKPVWVGRVAVSACADCGRVEWFSDVGRIDPAEAMAALFGTYEMLGPLDALGAPAPRVLAYRPPSGRKRSNLDAFPKQVWLQTGPHLWMSHDGETLLLAPTRDLVFDNLSRGA